MTKLVSFLSYPVGETKSCVDTNQMHSSAFGKPEEWRRTGKKVSSKKYKCQDKPAWQLEEKKEKVNKKVD